MFGIKGGAAGGGYSQIIPMEDFNLHLTGDVHAIGAAHNLAAAFIDNHIHHGNALGIDPHGDPVAAGPRHQRPRAARGGDRPRRHARTATRARPQFVITVASEVMAILALASDLAGPARAARPRGPRHDPRRHADHRRGPQGRGRDDGRSCATRSSPTCSRPSRAARPSSTAGRSRNIAHGNSSVLADRVALATNDIVVTEAGFGADMGAEKFFDIKCRASGLKPDAAVIVATVRALKMHGGVGRIVAGKPLDPALLEDNPDAVRRGGANLAEADRERRGCSASRSVVAINTFPTDTAAEIEAIREVALAAGARDAVVARHFTDGGAGAEDLATAVWAAAEAGAPDFQLLYPDDMPRCARSRRSRRASTAPTASTSCPPPRSSSRSTRRWATGSCRSAWPRPSTASATTRSSLGRPTGFRVPIREVRLSAGAGLRDPARGRHAHDARPQLAAGRRADRHRRGRERRRAVLTPPDRGYARAVIVPRSSSRSSASYIIARTVLSAVRTFVVPRGDNDPLSRFAVPRDRTPRSSSPPRRRARTSIRDRVMAYYGPIALILLPALWLVLLALGFARDLLGARGARRRRDRSPAARRC